MNKNRFNLIDEPWIPAAGKGLVSLNQIFSDNKITALGGNPVEKIAVFKLLLAIAQSAYTPANEQEWKKLGVAGLQKKILSYLNEQHDNFWLYGEKPFLQMHAIRKAKKTSFGDVQMMVATGNTTVVTQFQQEKSLSDAEKAMLVLTLMGFALGGKKTDNSVVLTPGYNLKSNEKGKPSTGKPGPSLAYMGLLHSFLFGISLQESIYYNLFTKDYITAMQIFPELIGSAPWEQMPTGELDDTAKKLTASYMGRLISLNRFILLDIDGIHYSEGIAHPNYADSVFDLSITIDFSASKPKVLWANPEKKPWRQLSSLLSFIKSTQSFNCFQLKNSFNRAHEMDFFTIWSGGVRISSNAGEQYLSGTDDFVESEIKLSSSIFSDTASFFDNLTSAMDKLDQFSKFLYSSVLRYYKELMMDGGDVAAKATNLYWQLCENRFQQLVTACEDSSGEKAKSMMPSFYGFVLHVYDRLCPNQTARQMESWVKNRPFNTIKEKTEEVVK